MNETNKNFTLKQWELVNFCEFDKYAIKSYCAIHDVDENLNLGDITKVDETKLKPFNMICGGSPCQDFSVAGKQKGSVWTCLECGYEYNPLTAHWSKRDICPNCHSTSIEKTRSSLLVEYLRVIRTNKPNFGIYENVKNIVGKQFKDTFKMFIDELGEYGYSVYWKVLNAKDYGVPQNRERVYLIFIKKELDTGKFKFPKGFDSGIRLKDILEEEVDEKYYISEDKVRKFIMNLQNTINEDDSNFPRFIGNINRPDFGTGYAGGVWDTNNISPTLTTMQGGGRQPHIMTVNKGKNEVKQVGNIVDTGNWDNPQRGRIYSPDGCSPALNCCGGGGLEPKIICGIDKSLNGTKFIDNANCLTAREDRGISNRKSEGTAIMEFNQTTKIRIRKLTPKECFRLMGFDDSAYEAASNVVSNSQMYKQTGNSIVVDVLYYILVELYKAMPYLFDDLRLSSFFSGIGAFEVALNRLYEGINTGNFTIPQVE